MVGLFALIWLEMIIMKFYYYHVDLMKKQKRKISKEKPLGPLSLESLLLNKCKYWIFIFLVLNIFQQR